MSKAFFFDRDGVINIEKNYLYKIDDFEFIDGVFDALRYVQDLGFRIFIITNQSGINRGYYSIDDFDTLTKWMVSRFEEENIKIDDVQFCPHIAEDNCNCRKPKTQMIENILNKYNIDIENSWLAGDKSSDILCANSIGIYNTIQVLSGHKFDIKKSKAKYVLDSIKDINCLL